MDPFVLSFYAIVCGILGWVAPNLGTWFVRIGIGAAVGIIAAAIMPILRSGLGF